MARYGDAANSAEVVIAGLVGAKGVGQFQPRATPWVAVKEAGSNTKGVGQKAGQFANPFQGCDTEPILYPECYPGLELTYAFGVKLSG